MTTLRKSAALALAATIAMTALAPAPAMAQDGCDWYVRISLQQQSSNLAKNCNFSGPQWSTDVNVHRSFCSTVRPIIWKKVAQMRKIKLSSCK